MVSIALPPRLGALCKPRRLTPRTGRREEAKGMTSQRRAGSFLVLHFRVRPSTHATISHFHKTLFQSSVASLRSTPGKWGTRRSGRPDSATDLSGIAVTRLWTELVRTANGNRYNPSQGLSRALRLP